MLETLRRNSRSPLIYLLFGILIAFFVLSFGPGSRGMVASSASSNTAAKVGGSKLSEQDFRFAYLSIGGAQRSPQMAKEQRLKEFVMDHLIERELLAAEAERLGFVVSSKEVEDMIADGRMMLLGTSRRVDSYVFKDGLFDYERFKTICQNQLGVSVARFIEIQRRELLADKMRETMRLGIRVSPSEVKAGFEDAGRQVNLEFVRFSNRKYESDDEPSTVDVAAYAREHDADLKKLYEERKPLLYTKIDKQLKLRHVLVDLAKDAPADAATKAQAQVDTAKKQLDSGAPFAQVAQQHSSNDAAKKRHGLLGWKKKGQTGFGEALDGKVFAADVKKGAVIGPVRSDRGFELVLVEDLREGDIAYEQAVIELAEQELVKSRAKDKAKADVQAALDKIKKGETLEALFPPKSDNPEHDKSPEANLARAISSANDGPSVSETGLFSRQGEMVPKVGMSKDLARRAFELPVGEAAGPFDVGGAYALVRVKEKKEPDMKDFDKRRQELEHQVAAERWAAAVGAFGKQRCVEFRDAGRIYVNEEVMAYEGLPKGGAADNALAQLQQQLGQGKGTAYVPCSNARTPF